MSETRAAPQPPTLARAWIGPVLVIAGALCIGFAPIGARVSEVGPQATAFWRFLFALPLLFALILVMKRAPPAPPNRAALLAGLFFGLDIALWHWGLEFTTVANAAFIVNLGNIGVGLLAWLVWRERPSRVWMAAAPAALLGAALLSQGGGAAGQGDLRGDVLSLGAAAMVAGYVLAAQRARRTLSALDGLFWMTVVELLVTGATGLLAGEDFWPQTATAWAPLIALAVVAQIGGQGLIVAGLGRTPAAVAGVLILIQPVAASLLAWRLFGEALAPLQIAGAGLILAAVYIAQRRGRSKLS